MPQLDGLRAIAVLLVVWAHWAPQPYTSIAGTDLGFVGVQLFFVLSGFLITGILVNVHQNVCCPADRWLALCRFYARRALRIFPLYYLILLLVVLLGVSPFRETWPWHAAYLSNFNFWLTGSHLNVHGGHLWSLSVEEQFYLLWPFILFVRRKLHVPLILSVICIAPAFRAVIPYFSWGVCPQAAGWLTPSVLDSLGTGGLLACLERQNRDLARRVACLMLVLAAAGLFSVFLFGCLGFLKQSFCACAFGWIIWQCSRGFGGCFGRWLQCRPMVYIGSISYGIYLIHGFALPFWYWCLYSAPLPFYRVFARLHIPASTPQVGWFTVIGMAVITVGAASLSFRFFEKPIMSLKKHLPYPRRSN